MRLKTRILTCLALLLALASPLRAQTCDNPITAVPCTISVTGSYALGKSVNTSPAFLSGCAITIDASAVTLDFAGYRLGAAAPINATSADGVCVQNRKGITIRNGHIRNQYRGIVVNDSGNARNVVVERMQLGAHAYAGIVLAGQSHVVRGTVVNEIGVSAFSGPDADAFGIILLGDGSVVDSDVSEVAPRGSGVAVAIDFLSGGLAQNLRLFTTPIGLRFGSPSGKYQNILTRDVSTPFVGGIDAGGNN